MTDFPQNPYPITGLVQGAGSGVTVKGINLSTSKSEQVTTETDGSFIIDPANMTDGYSDSDVIRLITGSWHVDVRIDLTNYPSGIDKDIDRPNAVINRRISRGAGLDRGISCGRSKAR